MACCVIYSFSEQRFLSFCTALWVNRLLSHLNVPRRIHSTSFFLWNQEENDSCRKKLCVRFNFRLFSMFQSNVSIHLRAFEIDQNARLSAAIRRGLTTMFNIDLKHSCDCRWLAQMKCLINFFFQHIKFNNKINLNWEKKNLLKWCIMAQLDVHMVQTIGNMLPTQFKAIAISRVCLFKSTVWKILKTKRYSIDFSHFLFEIFTLIWE